MSSYEYFYFLLFLTKNRKLDKISRLMTGLDATNYDEKKRTKCMFSEIFNSIKTSFSRLKESPQRMG